MTSKVTVPPWNIPWLDDQGFIAKAWQRWIQDTFGRTGGTIAQTNIELQAGVEDARAVAISALMGSFDQPVATGISRDEVLALIHQIAYQPQKPSGIDWQTAYAAQILSPRQTQSASSSSGVRAFTYASSAPSSPGVGDEWIDSDTGIRYEWIDDGTSTQWVEF